VVLGRGREWILNLKEELSLPNKHDGKNEISRIIRAHTEYYVYREKVTSFPNLFILYYGGNLSILSWE
jgi:hypothetical protein